jgi:hypothetical protein
MRRSQRQLGVRSGCHITHPFQIVVSVMFANRAVVVSGCPMCKKRINTMTCFLDHLEKEVMLELINRLAAKVS